MEERNQMGESIAVLEKKKIGRKDFLKFSAAAGAVLAISTQILH